jgi:hypothetical protein
MQELYIHSVLRPQLCAFSKIDNDPLVVFSERIHYQQISKQNQFSFCLFRIRQTISLLTSQAIGNKRDLSTKRHRISKFKKEILKN